MWAVVVMIILCTILSFALWWYYKEIVPGKVYYVGKTYEDPKVEPFTNQFFKTRSCKKNHTAYYIVTKLTEDIGNMKAGTTILFDELKQPKVGDFCLFERKQDKKLRIAVCTNNGKLRYEPDFFDGHETPGIGYNLLGVAQYVAGE